MHTFCFSVTTGDREHDEITDDVFHALTLVHLLDEVQPTLLYPERVSVLSIFYNNITFGVSDEEAEEQADDHHSYGLELDAIHQDQGFSFSEKERVPHH